MITKVFSIRSPALEHKDAVPNVHCSDRWGSDAKYKIVNIPLSQTESLEQELANEANDGCRFLDFLLEHPTFPQPQKTKILNFISENIQLELHQIRECIGNIDVDLTAELKDFFGGH